MTLRVGIGVVKVLLQDGEGGRNVTMWGVTLRARPGCGVRSRILGTEVDVAETDDAPPTVRLPAGTREYGLDIGLRTSARYWYAQALATGIRRHRWPKVTPERINTQSGPKISLRGAKAWVPRVVEVFTPGHVRGRIRPARITLGWIEHQRVLSILPEEVQSGWWRWLGKRYDRHGRPAKASALFRSHGERVVAGENSEREERLAALALLDAARVETWVP